MHTMSFNKLLDILNKAENGEKVNPSRKPLYTTLHGLCKHNGTGHASLKYTSLIVMTVHLGQSFSFTYSPPLLLLTVLWILSLRSL